MEYFSNRSLGTLSAGIASGATSVTLNSGDGARFLDPAIYGSFYAWIYDASYGSPALDPNAECVSVTAKSTNTFAIAGAQKGSSAANHNTVGKTYYMVAGPSAETFNELARIGAGDVIPAYQFNGVNNYVSVADNANLNFGTGDFTVEWWGNIITTANGCFFQKGIQTGSQNGYGLRIAGSNFDIFIGAGDTRTVISTNIPTILGWQFLSLVYARSGNVVLYRNGIAIYSTSIASYSATVTTADNFRLGAFGGSSYFSGNSFGLTRLYNYALSASEVLDRWVPTKGRPDLYQIPFQYLGASQTELVTNGSYTTDTDWTKNGNSTIADGVGHVSAGGIYQHKVLIPQKQYKVFYTISNYSAGSTQTVWYRPSSGGSSSIAIAQVTGNGVFTATFITNSNVNAELYLESNTGSFDIDNVSLTQIGNVADYRAINAGRIGWIDASGNQLSGQTSGNPLCLNTESRPTPYRDIKKGIANTATTLTAIVPRGYKIDAIRLKGYASLTGVKIGTSSGGEQVVSSTTASTTASLATLAATANAGYTETADQTLYVEHATAGQTLDIIIEMVKVGN